VNHTHSLLSILLLMLLVGGGTQVVSAQQSSASCMDDYFTKLKFGGTLVPLEEGHGRWELAMEPSTTSDKITFYACLPSEPVSKDHPNIESPSLFVICGIGVIDVAAIVTVDYGVKKNTHVLTRFDDAEPETATWKITRDKKAIIAPMTGGEFAKKLMMHDVLSVQLTLGNQQTVEFTYDLQGSVSSLNLLRQACKWGEDESKDHGAMRRAERGSREEKPHLERCVKWGYEGDQFAAKNICDEAVFIQFQKAGHPAIERQLMPGGTLLTGLKHWQMGGGGYWIFTACPAGYVSSVPFRPQNNKTIEAGQYSCVGK